MERGEGPGAGLGAALEAAQSRGAAEAVERALARYNEEVTGGERGPAARPPPSCGVRGGRGCPEGGVRGEVGGRGVGVGALRSPRFGWELFYA